MRAITYRQMLGVALVLALLWWLAALLLRESGRFLVWDDQQVTFTRALFFLDAPYALPGYKNPPWGLIILTPFSLLSLPLATLLQMLLYFAVLTRIIYQYGGSARAALTVLLSPLALDAAINLNIDWLIGLALIIPREWSVILLLLKPQTLPGYVLVFSRLELMRAAIIGLTLLLVSLLLWGVWIIPLVEATETASIAYQINFAPRNIIGLIPSLIIGAALSIAAWRRRDVVLAVWAGIFFVPYIASYSLLIHFALAAARWTKAAMLLTVALWVSVVILWLVFAASA